MERAVGEGVERVEERVDVPEEDGLGAKEEAVDGVEVLLVWVVVVVVVSRGEWKVICEKIRRQRCVISGHCWEAVPCRKSISKVAGAVFERAG